MTARQVTLDRWRALLVGAKRWGRPVPWQELATAVALVEELLGELAELQHQSAPVPVPPVVAEAGPPAPGLREAYGEFIRRHRATGLSMPEIGRLWRAQKAGGPASES